MAVTFRNRAKSIGTKLATIVFASTFMIIIIIWILLLFSEYRRELENIDESITQIKIGHLEGLKAAVWDLSEERINNALLAISSNNIVSQAEIRYLDLMPVYDESDVYRVEKFTLQHPIGGDIGYLYVMFSKSAITSEILRNTGNFTIVLVPIFFMSLVILLLFRVYVTKPLKSLSQYTSSINLDTIDREFDLHDKAKIDSHNELGILLDSINSMRLNIKKEDTRRRAAERDLQDLQKSLENIINSIPSMIIGIDIDKQITQWNYEAEKITGYTSEAALGRQLMEIIPRLQILNDKITSSVKNNTVESGSVNYKNDHGRAVFEEISISPLSGDEVKGAVIRVDDISEKMMMEELMVQNEKMLSIGGLAAGIAHEINNPLAGMMQSTSVLSNRLGISKILPANQKAADETGITMNGINLYLEKRDIPRMLKSITEAGRRIAEIVQNMLSFSRQSENKRSSILIEELIKKTIELVSAEFNVKNNYDFKKIKISYDFGKDIPLVICERAKIQQVLLNILQNGAQAMFTIKDETYLPAFIIRTRIEKNEKMVRIDIEDNGPGMEKEIQKKIFEPFFTTKKEGHGTGLGLSVSYFIISDNHNGVLSVQSLPGEGSVFSIRLPVK